MTDLEALEARVRVLEDIEAIKNAMARYWRCLDDKLWDELPDCFTEDVIADYGQPGWRQEGRGALVVHYPQVAAHVGVPRAREGQRRRPCTRRDDEAVHALAHELVNNARGPRGAGGRKGCVQR